MSPIKFEENIKQELEERTISVSNKAWDKLSNRLDLSKNPKNKSFWWMGIAASIIVVLWFAVDFINTPEIMRPSVVIEPEIKQEIRIKNNFEKLKEREVLVAQEIVEIKEKERQEQKSNLVLIENTENKIPKLNVVSIPLKVVEVSTLEEQKIQEIVAYVLESKKQNELVSDAEIEDLMLHAQNEIQLQKLFNDTSSSKNAQVLSADALLYEVESEIDKTFRDKVFKELKIQFKSIKNAVAQRNN
ncbi:MAG: hypothetical protein ACI9DK_003202 [Vicingaceae bacterium]|jgi:hypothetical protein